MATETDCIDALRTAADELGDSPTKAQYETLGLRPSASTILRHCGTWNDAKAQAGLETNASRGPRVSSPPDDVSLPEDVEWDDLTQDQRWHYRNRDWNAQRTLERRRRHREWLAHIKGARGCLHCGETEPACLDFHHRDQANKTMKLSQLVTYGHAKGTLLAEIAKCDVLCANCHRTVHDDTSDHVGRIELVQGRLRARGAGDTQQPSFRERQRAWVSQYKHERGCSRCRQHVDPVALDLHHLNPAEKSKTICRLITDGCPTDRLLAEVEKCDVLCANCHRNEHGSDYSSTKADHDEVTGKRTQKPTDGRPPGFTGLVACWHICPSRHSATLIWTSE